MNMYSVLIDKNNKDEHELNGLINEDAVFRKVKLGDCFTFNEKMNIHNRIENIRSMLALIRIQLIIMLLQKIVKSKRI